MIFGRKKDPQELIARKEYKKAIEIYRDRLKKQKENDADRLALADALVADQQVDEAIKEYKYLAELYTKQGFLVKAIAIYKRILKLKPELKEIEALLVNLSEKRGTDVQAVRGVTDSQESVQQQQSPEPVAELEAPTRYEIENKLFRGLARDEFNQIVKKLSLRHFDEETVVVKEGDSGSSLFIIVSGQVRVITKDLRQKEMILANLGEGEFFGEISLLTGKPRTATVITNMNSEMLELTKEDYENIVQQYPRVKQVVEAFHQQRAYRTVEAMIQSLRTKP